MTAVRLHPDDRVEIDGRRVGVVATYRIVGDVQLVRVRLAGIGSEPGAIVQLAASRCRLLASAASSPSPSATPGPDLTRQA